MAYKVTSLDSGWEFKQIGAVGVPEWSEGFLPVSQFPTNIHLDLMKHGKITDPYIGLNEKDVQWVGEQQWMYQTVFNVTVRSMEEICVLQFYGLDTFATVSLNNAVILDADNMHRTYRVDVTGMVKSGENTLSILFDVPLVRGQQLLENAKHRTVAFNGTTEKSRVFVRKAQYHYSWNWGPELMTCGPWRPVEFEQYSAKISDLWCRVRVNTEEKTARVVVKVETEGCLPDDTISLDILGPKGDSVVVASDIFPQEEEVFLEIKDAQFWWPFGHGEQPLYTVLAKLLRGGSSQHQISKKIGLREAQLVQRPLIDAPGTSFFIQVNGVPIYSNGSNWCPADHFLPRVSHERYRNILQMVTRGNQNTIRVWGGAVFEDDVFYDICDELGILVWQDFMFACAAYPANEEFIRNVAAEVEDNIRRLRHHPSIVAWNGNNEDYLFAELFNTEYDKKDSNPDNWLNSTFPARYIYEIVLPELFRRLNPDSNYHPGSPWGGKYFNDPTVGDTHMWEVWHKELPWQKYPELGSRFVSEFGMASLPHAKTIESYLVGASPFERHPNSRIVDHHNKEHQHERKLAMYLVENFQFTYEMEEYIYITQLNQAEAMTCALRAWRRGWKGEGREYCGGALIWQLNPTWQVTSKALIDYFNRPKLAYYTVKRDMSGTTIGLERKIIKKPRFQRTRAFVHEEMRLSGWATNITQKPITVVLSLCVFALSTGDEVLTREEIHTLAPNTTTELFDFNLPSSITRNDEPLIVSARLLDPSNRTVLDRCTNWPQPYRYLDMPRPRLDIQLKQDAILVKTLDVPVKGWSIYAEDVDAVEFEDNCMDLFPGDEQVIAAHGIHKQQLSYRYYGMKEEKAIAINSGCSELSSEGCKLAESLNANL